MNAKIDEILGAIRILEENLSQEIEKEEKKLTLEFSAARKQFKENLLMYFARTRPLHLLTAPIIYAAIIPALILELFLFVYQMINFRAYKIAKVSRNDYFVYDRASLEYLNIIEKLNCLYCSYFSGLVGYTMEIVGRTEQFWCPIRHSRKLQGRHSHYERFIPYGDGANYRKELQSLRDDLKEEG